MFFTVSYPEKNLVENSLDWSAVNRKRNRETIKRSQSPKTMKQMGHFQNLRYSEQLWLQSYRVSEESKGRLPFCLLARTHSKDKLILKWNNRQIRPVTPSCKNKHPKVHLWKYRSLSSFPTKMAEREQNSMWNWVLVRKKTANWTSQKPTRNSISGATWRCGVQCKACEKDSW